MALKIRNLSILAYANGFTLWHYKSAAERKSVISAESYFNDAGDMLREGDMILVVAADGGAMLMVSSEGIGGILTVSLTVSLT